MKWQCQHETTDEKIPEAWRTAKQSLKAHFDTQMNSWKQKPRSSKSDLWSASVCSSVVHMTVLFERSQCFLTQREFLLHLCSNASIEFIRTIRIRGASTHQNSCMKLNSSRGIQCCAAWNASLAYVAASHLEGSDDNTGNRRRCGNHLCT